MATASSSPVVMQICDHKLHGTTKFVCEFVIRQTLVQLLQRRIEKCVYCFV
jgi:hypothetical protein